MPEANPISVAILYTLKDSTTGDRNWQMAEYIAISIACNADAIVHAVPCTLSLEENTFSRSSKALGIIHPNGQPVEKDSIVKKERYRDGRISDLLSCDLWILHLDTECTLVTMRSIQNLCSNKKFLRSRAILNLQTAFFNTRKLQEIFPESIVLEGGVAFGVFLNQKNYLERDTNGAFSIERLSEEKKSAIYVFDLLESTGIPLLSRKNIQSINWGTSLIRLVYPIAKLVESSISSTLRDRKSRLFYLQLLDECMKLFQQMDEKARSAYARSKRTKIPSHMPDSIACANISLQTMMIMLPLPDWIFNTAVYPLLNIVTERTGLNSRHNDQYSSADFENEYGGILSLGQRQKHALPTMTLLNSLLSQPNAIKFTAKELLEKAHTTNDYFRHIKSFTMKFSIGLGVVVAIVYIWTSRSFRCNHAGSPAP